jgi:hypothetical protein
MMSDELPFKVVRGNGTDVRSRGERFQHIRRFDVYGERLVEDVLGSRARVLARKGKFLVDIGLVQIEAHSQSLDQSSTHRARI